MIRREVEFLQRHAEMKDGLLCCKQTGEPILSEVIGRSIWTPGFPGGSGEVRPVLHMACLACFPGAIPPEPGTPIYENELVDTNLSPIP
jgi:hypothetical protein